MKHSLEVGTEAGAPLQAHVLLVEDDKFVQDIYTRKLIQEKFRVTVASDGKQAMEIISKDVPDLLLLDIILPYLDGMEVLQKLKQRSEWQSIPVILLTNLSDREHIQRGLELGAEDYIIKSHFTPTEVVRKIQAVLSTKGVV